MTYKNIENYVIRTYGFESNLTITVFNMTESKVLTPTEIWQYIQNAESTENEDE